MHNRRVLFYDDAAVFGGHEEMTLNALHWMLSAGDFEVGFVYSPQNTSLKFRLEQLAAQNSRLKLIASAYTTRSLQFLRTPLALRAIRRLRAMLRNFKPDCLLVVQGEISLSSLGVLAARRERIPTISYIPLAHSRRQREKGIATQLKDVLLAPYYKLPDTFITISESMVSMLRARGATQPIRVVENGIDPDGLTVLPRLEARQRLGLPIKTYLAALVGRVEAGQKGHDIFLKAIAAHRNEWTHWKFLIVGDGPDKEAMMAMAETNHLSHIVEFLPWQQDLSALYGAVDLIVIPSRFEGVPVVMLEAMYCRLPIVASNCDAMAELLPPAWLFPVENVPGLMASLLQTPAMDQSAILERNRRLILERFTLELQGVKFANAVRELLDHLTSKNFPESAAFKHS